MDDLKNSSVEIPGIALDVEYRRSSEIGEPRLKPSLSQVGLQSFILLVIMFGRGVEDSGCGVEWLVEIRSTSDGPCHLLVLSIS